MNVIVLDNSHGNYVTETNFRDEIWDDPATHMWDFHPSLGTGLWLRNSDKNRILGNIFLEAANDGIFLDEKSTDNVLGKQPRGEQQQAWYQQPGQEQGRGRKPCAREHLGRPVPGYLLRQPVAQRIRPSRGSGRSRRSAPKAA